MGWIGRRHFLTLLGAGTLAGCGLPPDNVARDDVGALAAALGALGPRVDPAEARSAANAAYDETARLARAYRIEDPPLLHNTKVNMGLKPRGLCWHWAEDLQAHLDAQGFATLQTHRAIANADNPFRLDHSTAVLSAAGDPMRAGIVLDPWRRGGRLYWARVRDDDRYAWRARGDVWRDRGIAVE